MSAVYIPFAVLIAWLFVRWAMLSLDATNGIQDGRTAQRLFVMLWIAFNAATAIGGFFGARHAWLHWPQPIPPLLTMFGAAVWTGLFFVSSAMLVKALIRRGGFGDPEGRLSQPSSSSPIHD
jgi:hypothetical protein